MPTRRIIVAATARRELREIWTYLATHASARVADRILGEMHDALQLLRDMPGLGHYRNDVSDDRYRFWAVRSYILAYTADSRTLRVSRVLHGREDFRRIFGRRRP